MSRTGPARPNLTAQLQEKLRTDREQIEVLITAELKQLAESLNTSSKGALDIMERDTHVWLVQLRNNVNEPITAWFWSLESDTRHQGDWIGQTDRTMSSSGMRCGSRLRVA